MTHDPQVATSLTNLIDHIADEFPELKVIMDAGKAGTITEADAMRQMMVMVSANPTMGKRLQEAAMKALAPLRDPRGVRKVDTAGGLIMDRGRGLPRLNPLVEGALIERAQFDGDMPELRTGPLPRGQMPSVSVDTTARSSAAIGLMLGTASEQVMGDIQNADVRRMQLLEGMATDALELAEKVGSDLATVSKQDAIDRVMSGKSPVTDVAHYTRGSVPPPLAVLEPNGQELALMTEPERRQHAWKFLSTTQGRRSAVNTIQKIIADGLRKEGFEISERPFSPVARETVVAAHEWSVGLDGAGATQASFNLINTAAKAILGHLLHETGESRCNIILEVTTVNTVGVREVGWAGRLLSGAPILAAPE